MSKVILWNTTLTAIRISNVGGGGRGALGIICGPFHIMATTNMEAALSVCGTLPYGSTKQIKVTLQKSRKW